jgi:hypothetical protein
MVLAGGHRRRVLPRRPTVQRMPVRPLPMLVCRRAVILNQPRPLGAVVLPLWVEMRERCRTAGYHHHHREQNRRDTIDHHSNADPRVELLSTFTVWQLRGSSRRPHEPGQYHTVHRSDRQTRRSADEVDRKPDTRGTAACCRWRVQRACVGRLSQTFMSICIVWRHTVDVLRSQIVYPLILIILSPNAQARCLGSTQTSQRTRKATIM